MQLTITQTPPPIKPPASKEIVYERNDDLHSSRLNQSKAAEWGKKTSNFGQVDKLHNQSIEGWSRSDIFSAVSPSVINDKLFSAWLERMQAIFNNWDDVSLTAAITVSERYLIALRASADHRILISGLLNVLRFNPNIDTADIVKVAHAMEGLKKVEINRLRVTSFVRELRTIGYSPSAINKPRHV